MVIKGKLSEDIFHAQLETPLNVIPAGLTEDELLEMEEEELLARGIEFMSKEKDDLKQKMRQVRNFVEDVTDKFFAKYKQYVKSRPALF